MTFGILPIHDLVLNISPIKGVSRLATRQFSSVLEATVTAGIKIQTLCGQVDSDYFDNRLLSCPYGWMDEVNSEKIWRNMGIKPYTKNLEIAFHNRKILSSI